MNCPDASFYSTNEIFMFHMQLQGFIKQEMEKNEFTVALANDELVFFVVCCWKIAHYFSFLNL